MEKRDDEAADRIDDAEGQMRAAENEDDPVRLEAISQLHDILELELDRPEDEGEEEQSATTEASEAGDADES